MAQTLKSWAPQRRSPVTPRRQPTAPLANVARRRRATHDAYRVSREAGETGGRNATAEGERVTGLAGSPSDEIARECFGVAMDLGARHNVVDDVVAHLGHGAFLPVAAIKPQRPVGGNRQLPVAS